MNTENNESIKLILKLYKEGHITEEESTKLIEDIVKYSNRIEYIPIYYNDPQIYNPSITKPYYWTTTTSTTKPV